MTKSLRKNKAKKAGLAPGSLVYTGDRSPNTASEIKLKIFDYTENELNEIEVKKIEDCFHFSDTHSVTWINIDGVHDTGLIQKVGDHFKIHPLVLEDIVHTTQRPKIEEHDGYLYIVLRMLDYDSVKNCTSTEQISIILTNNCVISFQENAGDIFNPIRERIRLSKGRLRKSGADYLTYTLIDAIVDHYFTVLEKIGEKIQDIEDAILDHPEPKMAHVVHSLKQETIMIRKAVWPLREVISSLERLECPLLNESLDPFLRDLYDHTIRVIDAVESYRDILSGLLEIYLATVSNKMNEIMKVLTIISTIFIPLTFIAGIYGMNFKYMPELEWQNGYFMSLGLMALVAISLLIFFRTKKWI